MKKSIKLTSLLLLLTGLTLHAQSLETVLEKHYSSMGFKNLKNIKTVVIKASMSTMGMATKMDMYVKPPNKSRIEVDMMGNKMIQGYNGTDAWMKNPATGDIVDAPGQQKKMMESSSQIEGPLWKYKEKGYQVSYVGETKVNEIEYYKLKVIDNHGEEAHAFINTKSNLLDMMQSDTPNGAVTVMFEDYKPVDDVQLFHKMTVKMGDMTQMTMTYDEMKTNVPLEDSMFSKPK